MKRALALLVLILAIAASPAVRVARSQAAGTIYLTPNNSLWHLIPGTEGSSIDLYYYREYPVGMRVLSCSVSGIRPGPPSLGLSVAGYTADCEPRGDEIYVEVHVRLAGKYSGTRGDFYPLRGGTVTVVGIPQGANSTVVERYNLDYRLVVLEPDNISLVYVSDAYNYRLAVRPSPPTTGVQLEIVTVGDVDVSIVLDYPPDAPSYLVFESGGGRTVINVPKGEISVKTTVSGIPLQGGTIEYRILSPNGIVMDSGSVVTSVTNADYTLVEFDTPYVTLKSGANGYIIEVVGTFYVYTTTGSMTVSLTGNLTSCPTSKTTATVSASGSGGYRLVLECGEFSNVKDALRAVRIVEGKYTVDYTGKTGTLTFTIPYRTGSPPFVTGTIVAKIFEWAYLLLMISSTFAFIVGMMMRRPDLAYSGLYGVALAVIVLMLPSILGFVVDALAASGAPNPVGVRYITINNLPTALGYSIEYIEFTAYGYGQDLTRVGKIIMTLSAPTIVIPFIGAAGAGELFLFGLLIYILGLALEVLALIYPIVLDVAFLILAIYVMGQALVGSLSGTPTAVFGPLVNLLVLMTLIITAPILLAAIDQVKYDLYMYFNLANTPLGVFLKSLSHVKWVGFIFSAIYDALSHVNFKIPNPAAYLVIGLAKLLVVAMVIWGAITRALRSFQE